MILKKNYLFLSVLFAVAFSLVACSKGTRLLVVEGLNTDNPQLFITNSKGDKNKTNITPSLPNGYKFSGSASFINANKQRIQVSGSRTDTDFRQFSCNLRGKDVIMLDTIPTNSIDAAASADRR